jgi:hypothetical protein
MAVVPAAVYIGPLPGDSCFPLLLSPKCSYAVKTLIALDPGASGGIAFESDGQPADAAPMPQTEGDLVDLPTRLACPPGRVTS